MEATTYTKGVRMCQFQGLLLLHTFAHWKGFDYLFRVAVFAVVSSIITFVGYGKGVVGVQHITVRLDSITHLL